MVLRSSHQLAFDGGSRAGALFAWDPAVDRETRITPDDAKRRALVAFRADRLWYVVWSKDRFEGTSSLCAADIRSGSVRAVHHVSGAIQAYDVDAAGDRVAYYVRASGKQELHIRSLSSREDLVVYSATAGRFAAGALDEIKVLWSADGLMVLLNDSLVDVRGLRILRRDGSNVIAPRPPAGTALWSREPGRVLFSPSGPPEGAPKDWFFLDVGTGQTQTTRANGGRSRGVISPDGTRLAYDPGDASQTTVYRLDGTMLPMSMGGNVAALLWLNDHEVLGSETTCCAGWHPTGRGTITDVDTARGWRAVKLGSTFDAVVVR